VGELLVVLAGGVGVVAHGEVLLPSLGRSSS
jgi:hypothetical protein